jgi:alcohol dehydrogenase
MIAIPTTAGTGSEVSYGAVVRDAEHNVKMVFGDLYLAPNTAILDPKMTEGLPARLTAATGLDALTHDIEAFTATQAQPFTDAVALHSMKLIRKYLPRCVEKGDDLEARGQMQIAASMGAVAFNNALLGLTHAMAHALGARYGVHHGTANALFLPHVMLFNLEAVPERFAAIAEALGEDIRGLSASEASQAAALAVWRLTKQLGLPQRLRDLSVDQDSLAAMAEVAITDACLLTNPRPVTDPAEILSVYKEAW